MSRVRSTLEDLARKQLCRVMEYLYYGGLISLLSGNASVKIGKYVLITPSRVPKPELSPEKIVKLDLEGNVVEGEYPPSIEYPMHLEIYRRTEYTAVVHAHNPLTVLVAEYQSVLRPLTLEAREVLGEEIPVLPELRPGSQELAKQVAEKIAQGYTVVILKRHGVVAVGGDPYEALYRVELVEEIALQQLLSKLFSRT